VEMPFRCCWAFPKEEKCLLDLPMSILHHVPFEGLRVEIILLASGGSLPFLAFFSC
jgi:hypothetical protein